LDERILDKGNLLSQQEDMLDMQQIRRMSTKNLEMSIITSFLLIIGFLLSVIVYAGYEFHGFSETRKNSNLLANQNELFKYPNGPRRVFATSSLATE
jgi:hypothetical protein